MPACKLGPKHLEASYVQRVGESQSNSQEKGQDWWHTPELTAACAIEEEQYSLQLLTWATWHLPIYLINFMNLRTNMHCPLHICHLNDKGTALKRLPQEWCTSLGSPRWWLFKIYYRKKPTCSKNEVIFTRHPSQQIPIKPKISCKVHREHRVTW